MSNTYIEVCENCSKYIRNELHYKLHKNFCDKSLNEKSRIFIENQRDSKLILENTVNLKGNRVLGNGDNNYISISSRKKLRYLDKIENNISCEKD